MIHQIHLKLKIKTPLTKDAVSHIIGDIEMPSAIINEFNLDSDKFKKIGGIDNG